MKLDKVILDKIMNLADGGSYDFDWFALKQYLENLDLVIKLGDSSQSTLVENVITDYLCKDCGKKICGNYVTAHFDCTDIHPNDRKLQQK